MEGDIDVNLERRPELGFVVGWEEALGGSGVDVAWPF